MRPGDSRWPVLYNVILVEGFGRTVEIDHLVRVPDGILVLETKTYAGFIDGGADAPYWTQHLAGGRCTTILNPAIQNSGKCGRSSDSWRTRSCGSAALSSRREPRGSPMRSRTSPCLASAARCAAEVCAGSGDRPRGEGRRCVATDRARACAGRRPCAAHEAYGRRRPDECRRSACGANFRAGGPVPLHGRVRGRYGCADPRKTQSVT